MKADSKLATYDEATNLIKQGNLLIIAAREELLKTLPEGLYDNPLIGWVTGVEMDEIHKNGQKQLMAVIKPFSTIKQ